MPRNEQFFSVFTNSKFLCIDKCLTVIAVLVLSQTLNTASVSAQKSKTSFQNASRLSPAQTTTTSSPSFTVEDFSRYIDSKSQSETEVLDISEVTQGLVKFDVQILIAAY